MGQDDVYTRPAHIDELLAVWAARDDLYARRSLPLTDTEVAGIVVGRKREAEFLPTEQRARAWASASEWYPPDHGK